MWKKCTVLFWVHVKVDMIYLGTFFWTFSGTERPAVSRWDGSCTWGPEEKCHHAVHGLTGLFAPPRRCSHTCQPRLCVQAGSGGHRRHFQRRPGHLTHWWEARPCWHWGAGGCPQWVWCKSASILFCLVLFLFYTWKIHRISHRILNAWARWYNLTFPCLLWTITEQLQFFTCKGDKRLNLIYYFCWISSIVVDTFTLTCWLGIRNTARRIRSHPHLQHFVNAASVSVLHGLILFTPALWCTLCFDSNFMSWWYKRRSTLISTNESLCCSLVVKLWWWSATLCTDGVIVRFSGHVHTSGSCSTCLIRLQTFATFHSFISILFERCNNITCQSFTVLYQSILYNNSPTNATNINLSNMSVQL